MNSVGLPNLRVCDYPDTLTSRNNLAYAYRLAGRLAETIDVYERVLADGELTLGPDHPLVATISRNLAILMEPKKRRRRGWW